MRLCGRHVRAGYLAAGQDRLFCFDLVDAAVVLPEDFAQAGVTFWVNVDFAASRVARSSCLDRGVADKWTLSRFCYRHASLTACIHWMASVSSVGCLLLRVRSARHLSRLLK